MRPLAVDVEWRTSDGSGFSPGTVPMGLVERLSKPKASPRTESVDERLKRAEERRQVRALQCGQEEPFILLGPGLGHASGVPTRRLLHRLQEAGGFAGPQGLGLARGDRYPELAPPEPAGGLRELGERFQGARPVPQPSHT